MQLRVRGTSDHAPDIRDPRIRPHRARQVRMPEVNTPAGLYRPGQGHVVDQCVPHGFNPANPDDGPAPDQDGASRRCRRATEWIIYPCEWIKQLKVEYEGGDQCLFRQSVAW